MTSTHWAIMTRTYQFTQPEAVLITAGILIVGMAVGTQVDLGGFATQPQFTTSSTQTSAVDQKGPLINTALPSNNTNEKLIGVQKPFLLEDMVRWKSDNEKFQPNFTNIAIMVLDLDEVTFETDPASSGLLDRIITISNLDSIRDVFSAIVEFGWRKSGGRHGSGGSQGSQTSSTSSNVTQDISASGDDGWTVATYKSPAKKGDRSPGQQKLLSNRNCGPGALSFKTFSYKHLIIDPNVQPNEMGSHSYDITVERRINDPYTQFTFFFMENQDSVSYHYNDNNGKCEADQLLPAFTCFRYDPDGNDHLHTCVFVGQCRPTYRKADGHLIGPYCKTMPGSENMIDYSATLEKMGEIREKFLKRLIEAPPTKSDRIIARWRSDKHRASLAGEAALQTFLATNPKPNVPLTKREKEYAQYKKDLALLTGVGFPKKVLNEFYHMPVDLLQSRGGYPPERRGFFPDEDKVIVRNPTLPNWPQVEVETPPGVVEGEDDLTADVNEQIHRASLNLAQAKL